MRMPPKAGSVIAVKMRESLIKGRANLRPDWCEVFQRAVAKAMSKPSPIYPKKRRARSCKPYMNSGSIEKRQFGKQINENVLRPSKLFTLENDKLDLQKNAVSRTYLAKKDLSKIARQKDFEEPSTPVKEAALLKNLEEPLPPVKEAALLKNLEEPSPPLNGPPLLKENKQVAAPSLPEACLIETDLSKSVRQKDFVEPSPPVKEALLLRKSEDVFGANFFVQATDLKSTSAGRSMLTLITTADEAEQLKKAIPVVEVLKLKKTENRPAKPEINLAENSKSLGNCLAAKKKRGRPPKSKVNSVENSESQGKNSAVKKKRGRPPTKQQKPGRNIENLVNFSLPAKPEINLAENSESLGNGLAAKKKRGRPPMSKVNSVEKSESQGNNSAVKRRRGRPPTKQQKPGKIIRNLVNFSLPIELVKPKFRIVPADRPYKYIKKNVKEGKPFLQNVSLPLEDSNIIINYPNTTWSFSESVDPNPSSKQAEIERSPLDSNQHSMEQEENNNEDESLNIFLKKLEQISDVREQDLLQADEHEYGSNSVIGSKEVETETSPLDSNQQLMELDQNNNDDEIVKHFLKNLDDSVIEQILEMCEQDSIQANEPESNNNSVSGSKQADTETSPLDDSNQQFVGQDENNNDNSAVAENMIPWAGAFEDLINFVFDVPTQKANEEVSQKDSVDSPINFDLRQSIADDYDAKLEKIQEGFAPHFQNWGHNILTLLRRSKEKKRKDEGRILVRNPIKKTNKQVHFCFD